MGQARFQLRSQMALAGDRRGVRMTYRMLSEEAGVSTSTLSRMANNEQTMISLSVLERICNALACTPNDLLWVEGDESLDAGRSPIVYDEPRPGYQVLRDSD